MFIRLVGRVHVMKLWFSTLTLERSKLERLSMTSVFLQVECLRESPT
jgi:hypothetical protein